MNCVIIEDLKVAADYLNRCCTRSGLVRVEAHFTNVADALGFLNSHTTDLLFLDVEMPGATGFELLDNLAYKPKVILTTSKEEYAYNAFQYDVQDFLKKPFTYERFMAAINRIGPAQEPTTKSDSEYFFLKIDSKLVRLNYDDILYIESMNNYVRFVTDGNTYINYNTLKDLEDGLLANFLVRVHRSYIINVRKIDQIRDKDLIINGKQIPVSPMLRTELLKKFHIF